MKPKTILSTVGICGIVLGLGLGANAAVITQTAAQGSGTSWNTADKWSDGLAPSASNDYVNALGGNSFTRTPTTPDTFAGGSLTMTNGSSLLLYLSTYTVNNLTLVASETLATGYKGGRISLVGSPSLSGTLALTGTGTVTLDAQGGNRMGTISSLVTADATVSSIVIDVLQTPPLTAVNTLGFILTNPGNTFNGLWDVQKGMLKGVGFGTGSFFVGTVGYLDFDYDYNNPAADLTVFGGKLLLDQDVTVGTATFGITDLEAGVYTGAVLKANATYGSLLDAASSDTATLTVVTGPPPPAMGDTIYQTASHPAGVNWNDPTFWDNGLAPISTNFYVNANDDNGVGVLAWHTRTPTNSGSASFGGASLTLTNGAVLNIKSLGPWTVNPLIVWAGSTIQNGSSSGSQLAGKLVFDGTGSVHLDAQIPGRLTTISAYIAASASVTGIVVDMTQTAPTTTVQAATGGFLIVNPLNDFSGLWDVQNGLLKGVGFGSGNFRVSDLGYLDFDADYIGLAADLTIEANPTNAAQSGMMLLDQNVAVASATIWGVSLAPGHYLGLDLKADPTYGAAFDPASLDGAVLTVGVAPIITQISGHGATDVGGWLTSNSWSNGQAPSPDFEYINNTDAFNTRPPQSSVEPDPIFLGKSLTLSDGADFVTRHSGTAVVSNLTLIAGSGIKIVGVHSLDGGLNFKGTGIIPLSVETNNRRLTIDSLVTAEPTVTLQIFAPSATFDPANRTNAGYTFTNPSNTYSGVWDVQEGFLKGSGFGYGSFLIGESGYLDFDADYVNTTGDLTVLGDPTNTTTGGMILLDQDVILQSATLWGETLAPGTYTAAELKTNAVYGAAIDPASNDSSTLTVAGLEIDFLAIMPGPDAVVGWNGSREFIYKLQGRTDLLGGDWSNLVVDIVGVDDLMSVTSSAPQQATSYRLFGELAPPPPPTFEDDLENGATGWTNGPPASTLQWELGSPSVVGPAAAHSPVNCWGTDLGATYPVNQDIWLRSPVIDLTGAGSADLTFWQFSDMEDSGGTFTFDTGTVNILDSNNVSLASNVFRTEGSSGTWEFVSVTIPAAALGQPVIVEFVFHSDDFDSGDSGWYIDDVAVTKE